MSVKLIAIDFDSTLFTREGLSVIVKNLILDVIKNGIKVGVVTGRRKEDIDAFLSPYLDFGNFLFQFLIVRESFIYIQDGRSFSPDRKWNTARKREMVKLIQIILSNINSWLVLIGEKRLEVKYWSIQNDYGLELIFKSIRDAEAAKVLLKENLSFNKLVSVRRNSKFGVSVNLSTADKGKTLKRLVQRIGIAPNNVLAIGDSLNDQSMLDGRYGFLSGAVRNADKEIKKCVKTTGGIIATKVDGEGVVEIINRFLDGETHKRP